MNASKFIRIILIPAAVFQSVIFGGAYGTGRETAEYISSNGPIGGMLSLALIALGFGVILSSVLNWRGQQKYMNTAVF